jgi:hypothetical protein
MSVLAVGEAVDRIGEDIAETVVEMARNENSKPPSVAELYAIARRVRNDQAPHRLTLPSVDGIPMPPDIKAKYVRMVENLAGERVARMVDHEREVEEVDEEWRRLRAASLKTLRDVRSCPGFGQAPVEREGKWVCPGCDVEVSA